MTELSDYWVTIDPHVMGGAPCIKGTRITVTNILDIVAAGEPFSEIILDFPSLDKTKIKAALEYAAMILRRVEHD